jgi:hypothetical protein
MKAQKLQSNQKFHEVHAQNIQKALEHRLRVARMNSDEYLIGQLEAEMLHFGLVPAT